MSDMSTLLATDALDLVLKESKHLMSHEDFNLLLNVMKNPFTENIFKIYDCVEQKRTYDKTQDYMTLYIEVMNLLENRTEEKCLKLFNILNKPSIRYMMEAFSNIMHQSYIPKLPPHCIKSTQLMKVIRLNTNNCCSVGLQLGKHPDNCIFIKKVAKTHVVAFQDLLTEGDIIREINGKPVSENLAEVKSNLKASRDGISITVLPISNQVRSTCQLFVRCQFDYLPQNDDLIIEQNAGLEFKCGDILEIVDQSDQNWWQAKHVSDLAKKYELGLIPSLRLQMSRSSCLSLPIEALSTKHKKKIMYQVIKSEVFDGLQMPIYEGVTKMPPFKRKLLILVGAENVGCETIKNRILTLNHDNYATPIPDTSRVPSASEVSGQGYNFVIRDCILSDIKCGKYFEYGEHNGHLYGIRLDSVRAIINAGKTCVLYCNPSALKFLRTAEFMPFVVFIEAPNIEVLCRINKDGHTIRLTAEQIKKIVQKNKEISQLYCHLFDFRIVNNELETTYNAIMSEIERNTRETQWVSLSWVY